MRRLILLIGLICFALTACFGSSGEERDPRLGEAGRLLFTGGGCSGSTTMAAGSRDTLTMESADGAALPSDLSVSSSSPDVLEAHNGTELNTVDLVAHGEGMSHVVVRSGGAVYDSLFFGVEAAGAVRFTSVPLVFSGGAIDVVVTDVFGQCGTDDCPLFGHTFLRWTAESSEAPSFELDQGGTATFRAGQPGSFLLQGREPTGGKRLVLQPVEVVSTEGVTGYAATLTTVPLVEGEDAITISLPGAVAVSELFCVRLEALRGGELPVPVSRRDIVWSVIGSEVSGPLPTEHATEPLGTLFMAGDEPGHVVLVAEIGLLGDSVSFELDVAP